MRECWDSVVLKQVTGSAPVLTCVHDQRLCFFVISQALPISPGSISIRAVWLAPSSVTHLSALLYVFLYYKPKAK